MDPVSPLEGEAEAGHLRVMLACEQGYQRVILEGDSESIIKAINCWPQPID